MSLMSRPRVGYWTERRAVPIIFVNVILPYYGIHILSLSTSFLFKSIHLCAPLHPFTLFTSTNNHITKTKNIFPNRRGFCCCYFRLNLCSSRNLIDIFQNIFQKNIFPSSETFYFSIFILKLQ